MKRFAPMIQLFFVIILGLFVLKLASGWLAQKWPNAVTSGINHVVQSA